MSSAALGGLLGAALASWRPLKEPGAPHNLLAMWAPLLSAQALQELFWQPWLEQMSMATGWVLIKLKKNLFYVFLGICTDLP